MVHDHDQEEEKAPSHHTAGSNTCGDPGWRSGEAPVMTGSRIEDTRKSGQVKVKVGRKCQAFQLDQ